MPTTDPYGFDKMTDVELRTSIANLIKEIMQAEDDKKDFVSGVNDVIKDCKTRLRAAVEALKDVEAQAKSDALDEQATKLIEQAVKLVPAVGQ